MILFLEVVTSMGALQMRQHNLAIAFCFRSLPSHKYFTKIMATVKMKKNEVDTMKSFCKDKSITMIKKWSNEY
jgi:hypothetical protein